MQYIRYAWANIGCRTCSRDGMLLTLTLAERQLLECIVGILLSAKTKYVNKGTNYGIRLFVDEFKSSISIETIRLL